MNESSEGDQALTATGVDSSHTRAPATPTKQKDSEVSTANVRSDAGRIAGETLDQVGEATGEFASVQQVQRKGTSVGRGAIFVGAGILISRIVGLVRQRVFAHYFGLSAAGDAFSAAFRIPNFLQNIFGEGALSASFIPVYAKLLAHHDEEEAARVANAVLGMRRELLLLHRGAPAALHRQ